MASGRTTRSDSSGGGGAAPADPGPGRGPLRRAQASFGLMWTGESAFMVALAVVAFRDGGLAAVGVVTAVRMVTAAAFTPFLAATADRVRREVVLVTIGLVRSAALGGTAVVAAVGGPMAVTYGCAAVATVALALYRPAHSALLPALARSPRDLTGANAVRGMLDSVSALGGPLVAGALLATSSAATVFAVGAVLSLLSGLAVLALPYDAPPRAAAVRAPVTRTLVQGLATIAGNRDLALVTSLGVAQTLTRGALTVLTVVVALELLDTGEPGVGVLNAAVGAGGVLGSLGALALVGRGRLASWFGAGVALFGLPLVLVGAVPVQVVALLALALVGVGNALVDVAGFTILARRTDERVLARMFAAFEAALMLGVAAGGLLAPLAVDTLGARGSLVAVGLLAPVAVVLRHGALRRLDNELRVRDADIEVLRAVPMLQALPATTVEQLAADLEHTTHAPGATVVAQGEAGEEYFVVVSGRAEVVRDGRLVNVLERGAGFGDVALLADVPRTATVRAGADGPLRLAALRRSAFLTAVTGYPASAVAGRRSVAETRSRDEQRDTARGDRSPEATP
ncbi:MFS transporter [Aquipuribacter sp. SD81]|uniref:MFS transporter n=1 Tax=Aquipuribacter sp. SD81 TaxID=3127703 RepID=UPI003017BBD1